MMELKPGSRWLSAVSAAEVVVVRPPREAVTLESGGRPMAAHGESSPAIPSQGQGGILLGKRYTDAETGLEVLCVKAGAGELTVDGRPLVMKEPKALPSSD